MYLFPSRGLEGHLSPVLIQVPGRLDSVPSLRLFGEKFERVEVALFVHLNKLSYFN
jgi:hypothetical protein